MQEKLKTNVKKKLNIVLSKIAYLTHNAKTVVLRKLVHNEPMTVPDLSFNHHNCV